MRARRGRASYAGDDVAPAVDPGATAIADIAAAIAAGSQPPSWAALHERAAQVDTSVDDDQDARPRGLVSHPAALVSEALDGLVRAHPRLLRRLDGQQAVVARAIRDGSARVAVLSGGGAGHEPLHTGFVGEGMLDAACPGAVFTSPAPSQILAATTAVDRGAGVLYVVKRYTGDILNFGLAAELAAADRGRSYGIAIHGDEIELGVGIHGEPGRGREPLPSVVRFADLLVEHAAAELDVSDDPPVLVLLSGLGGTPQLQLAALYEHVAARLRDRDITIARSLVGDLITSLDQAGALLTLVALDDELLELWDAPVRTPAWTR